MKSKANWKKLQIELSKPGRARRWIEDCEFVEDARVIRPLVTWGIFNPFGPTVESLCLASASPGDAQVLYWKMSNPFQQQGAACGIATSAADVKEIEAQYRRLLTQPFADGEAFLKSAPSFVLLARASAFDYGITAALFEAGLRASSVSGLGEETSAIRRHWLKPWERTRGELGELFTELVEQGLAGANSGTGGSLTSEEFADWWGRVSDPEHALTEIEAVEQAWTGSINLQRDAQSPAAKSALNLEDGLVFHIRLLSKTP